MWSKVVGLLLVLVLLFVLSIPLAEESNWTLGEYKGYVAIYDPSGSLFELTNIHINSLPKKEQDELKKGLTARDHYELEQFLEGITQ